MTLLSEGPVIDGQFKDWPEMTEARSWTIQGTSDGDAIYLRLHHPGPPRVVQHLDEPLALGLDLDQQLSTGCSDGTLHGCELVFEMSPLKDGRPGGGVTARSWGRDGAWTQRSPYDFGFVMAPTTASRQHEIRINRATLPSTGEGIRVILQSGNELPHTVQFEIRPARKQPPAQAILPATSPGSIRIVSWNIERGGMLKRADLVKALLEEIQPDILLVQELEDNQDPKAIQALLNSLESDDSWTLAMSPRGSGLRTAVATRLPTTHVATFNHVTRSDAPNRTLRASGLLVRGVDGPSVMAISLHLKCCGGLNGREDLTRISEVLSLRDAIAEAVEEHQPVGLIIGGDLNLVASPVPLEILRTGGQSMLGSNAEGDLVVATPRHLDGRDIYTWYDADSSYTPGQLDFVLTGGPLVQSNAFVLDTADLAAVNTHQLPSKATEQASDHLPVVVDVRLNRE
ncbi:MAG: endonuclease/exonuclease/phosphatase family protein [Planctomycetota bacterium]|nr:endonuclease/exonuclease/phosphatase family protein [Planctomycetota bacterium]